MRLLHHRITAALLTIGLVAVALPAAASAILTAPEAAGLARAAHLRASQTSSHSQVIAIGHLRQQRLTLVVRHLRRGRYRLTLEAIGAHGKRTVIGHTSIVVS